MLKTNIRRVGNSFGITLPKTIIDNYHLDEGDEMNIIETEDGIVLTPYDPKFSEWVDAFERTNKKYRNTLHKLAK